MVVETICGASRRFIPGQEPPPVRKAISIHFDAAGNPTTVGIRWWREDGELAEIVTWHADLFDSPAEAFRLAMTKQVTQPQLMTWEEPTDPR